MRSWFSRLAISLPVLLLGMGSTTVISPTPVLHFTDNNGFNCYNCLLFTYQGGTTTKLNTFTDSTGNTQNTDPIQLNARGEANVWLAPGTAYKFTLSPAGDSDPPTNPIYTVDNIMAGSFGGVCVGNVPCVSLIVPTNAALQAQSTTEASFITRCGFYVAGDVACLPYKATAGSCAVADNGACNPSADGNSWVAVLPSGPADVGEWGATGSGTTVNCSMAATSAAATLSGAGDFQIGQPVACFGAGAAFSLNPPTSVAVATEGSTGSTTWCARLVSIDADHGYSAATTEVCDAGDGAATNAIPTGIANALDQKVTWTNPTGTPATAIGIYFGHSGAETCATTRAVAGINVATTWRYYSQSSECPAWLPTSPPSTASADVLRSTIVSGAGTTSVILADKAISSTSATTFEHDDWGPIQNTINAEPVVGFGAGTFRITKPLVAETMNGQVLAGCGQGCTTLAPDGTFDILSFAGNFLYDGLHDIFIEGSGMASGFGVVFNGPDRIVVDDVSSEFLYNEVVLTAVAFGHINEFYNFNRRKGDVGLYMFAASPSASTITTSIDINYYNSAQAYQGNSWYMSGCVPTFRTAHLAIQHAPTEVLIDNAASCTHGPQFPHIYELGLNGCWSPQPANNAPCMDLEAGNDFEFKGPYFQYLGPSGSGNVVHIANGVTDVEFNGGHIFGGGNNGIDFTGFGLNVIGTRIYANTNASIECHANGASLEVHGGSSLNVTAGTPTSAQNYGILLDQGCSLVTVEGNSWQGMISNVDDQVSPTSPVSISGLPFGSPATTVLNLTGNQILSVATYPNLYTLNGIAVFDASGFGSGTPTYTTDTATNILANLPNAQVGTQFRIRMNNHQTGAVTIAGGTGVTPTGQDNIPANGGSNQVGTRFFVGTVTNTGSPAITLRGCSIAAITPC